jgi:hypothetical protein
MLGNKGLLKLVLAVVLIVCALTLMSCSSEEINATEISSVRIEKGGEKVKAEAVFLDDVLKEYSGEKVYLLSMDLAESGNLTDGFEVIGEAKLKEKVSFSFDLCDELMRSRIAKAFVVAVKDGESYSTITSAAYIENPEALAYGDATVSDTLSIKGMAGNDTVTAGLVGAEHILLEADMDKLLLGEYNEGAVGFVSDGITYYFDGDEVAKLDASVKEANMLGMRVYMRTSLRFPELDEDETFVKAPIDLLYCKGTAYGAKGYMPNFANEKAVGYIKAFYNFLGARYSGEGCAVLDYIIGENVNDYKSYCNTALRGEEEVLSYYSSWVRLAHNVVTSHNANMSVYVSVNNSWRVEEGSSILGSKYFLSQFAQSAKDSGDYNWKIAISVCDPKDVTEVLAGDNVDYSRINTESFSELFDFLRSSSMIYASLPRDVIIDSISVPDDIAEANRAAYYTYTYYTAAEAGFDAMIYSCDSNSGLTDTNGDKNAFYYSVLLCGSDTHSQLSGYVQLIEYATVPDMNAYAKRDLTYEQTVSGEISSSALKNSKKIGKPLEEFVNVGGAYNSAIVLKNNSEGESYRVMTVYTSPSERFGGVACFEIPAADIVSSGYIGLRLSAEREGSVTLVISSKSSGGYSSYIGEVNVDSGAKDYYFNISSFTDSLDSKDDVSIMILSERKDGGENYSFDIENVALYGSSGNGSGTVIVVIAVAVGVIGVCGLLFWLASRRKRNTSSDNED